MPIDLQECDRRLETFGKSDEDIEEVLSQLPSFDELAEVDAALADLGVEQDAAHEAVNRLMQRDELGETPSRGPASLDLQAKATGPAAEAAGALRSTSAPASEGLSEEQLFGSVGEGSEPDPAEEPPMVSSRQPTGPDPEDAMELAAMLEGLDEDAPGLPPLQEDITETEIEIVADDDFIEEVDPDEP